MTNKENLNLARRIIAKSEETHDLHIQVRELYEQKKKLEKQIQNKYTTISAYGNDSFRELAHLVLGTPDKFTAKQIKDYNMSFDGDVQDEVSDLGLAPEDCLFIYPDTSIRFYWKVKSGEYFFDWANVGYTSRSQSGICSQLLMAYILEEGLDVADIQDMIEQTAKKG